MNLDFDDEDVYGLLLEACYSYKVEPSMSLESEAFFRDLLTQYTGSLDAENLLIWLKERIEQSFVALNKRPEWIQSSEWPFIDGQPAIFAGQIDISLQDNKIASQLIHDDTSFYLFIAPKKQPIVITQQY